MVAVVFDSLQISAGIFGEAVRILLEQDAGEAVDGAQRRPQVVGDGVGEGLQFPVCRFKLTRSRRDLFD